MSKLSPPSSAIEHHSYTQTEIYIEIPSQYQYQTIISRLVKEYNLEVNIVAAVLGNNGCTSGWFRLALGGFEESLKDALIYLSELKVIVLNGDFEGW
jgi:hypothetical protein